MTKEDAIYEIKQLAVLSNEKDIGRITEALEMAIEALQDRKTEPQTCETCRYSYITCRFMDKGESCNYEPKTEPQTDGYMTAEQAEDYRKMLDKAEHKVYGNIKDEPQTERVETMSCQECKWWFTDSLKHGGYCQSLLYNHECRYEPEVDCRRCVHFTTDKCQKCFGKELFIDSGYITKLGQPETDCSWK